MTPTLLALLALPLALATRRVALVALVAFLFPILAGVFAPATDRPAFDRVAYSAEMNRRYDALDDALAAQGWHRTSPWWREQVRRYFETQARQLVLRVGRRGGKSTTLCRIAVVEAWYGRHVIPPGDIGVVAFVSVSRDEASQRLRTIKGIHDACGMRYRPIEGGIELEGRPVAFKVFTASVAGVSGFTCICAICDEVAKWRDAETGANPAREVLASLRPSLATQPLAKIVLSSSPLSVLDAHYDAFELGESDFQIVAYAPTWIANPTISEEDTRRLEPDARAWRGEYLAEPRSAVAAAFDSDAVARAFVPREGVFEQAEAVLILDPSSGMADSWTWAVVRYLRDERGRWFDRGDGQRVTWPDGTPRERPDWKPKSPPILQFALVDSVDGAFWNQISGDEIVARLVALARKEGIRHVHADQREALMLSAAFERHGLRYHRHDYTSQSKVVAVEQVRRWLREQSVWLPSAGKGERLKKELLAFEERVTSTGQFTFRGRGTTHDDFAALLLTAALADADPGLPYSPHKRRGPCGVSSVPLPGVQFS